MSRIVVEQDLGSFLTHVKVIFRTGAMADPEDRPGLANLVVRSLMRGTRKRGYLELTRAIEKLGATLSVGVDHVQTQLSGVVLTENLDAFLGLIREIVLEPAFSSEEISHLKTLVQGELKASLQDVKVQAGRAFLKAAYQGTAFQNPAGGTVAGVAAISKEDIQSLYRKNFNSDNLLIGMTSALDPGVMTAKLKAVFEGLPSRDKDVTSPDTRVPAARLGSRAVIAASTDSSTVPFYLAVPGLSDADPDLRTLEIWNYVFGADFTSRLMQVLRGENGWTYGAYSGYTQIVGPMKDAGLFSIYSFPSAEFAGKAISKSLELLQKYSERGISEDEFQAAREALVNRYPFRLDSAEKRLDLQLREILTGRPFESPSQYRARLLGLTRDQVNQVAAKRTGVKNFLLAAVGDPDTLRPALQELPGIGAIEIVDVEA